MRTWIVDFEYATSLGERARPHTLCGLELETGREIRFHGGLPKRWPFASSRIVLYSAAADVGAMLALGWSAPKVVFDLEAEFRREVNGILPTGKGTRTLLSALSYFGLPHSSATEKELLQKRCAAGPPFTAEESRKIIEYCMDDVRATAALYEKLRPTNDVDEWRALHRGRYTTALASVVHRSTPIDVPLFARLKERWSDLVPRLVEQFPITREVYVDGSFNHERFARALRKRGIKSWPLAPAGQTLKTDKVTLRDMAERYPELAPLVT